MLRVFVSADECYNLYSDDYICHKDTVWRSANSPMKFPGKPPVMIHRLFFLAMVVLTATSVVATSVMPLGDSITSGHAGFASYRYPLWFGLVDHGYAVDLVGNLDDVPGGPPNAGLYPEYSDGFDRDHEGHWGFRSDQILPILSDALIANDPDIVLIHLGTNDIGQRGEVGLASFDDNLRLIIGILRGNRPEVVILLAKVIPIGTSSFYGANAHLVEPLNQVIEAVAEEESTIDSPIVLVDQHTGFDLATMMQGDGIHPNAAGEERLAWWWLAALASVLSPGTDAPVPAPSLALRAQPNPFNPATTVAFDVPASGPVWLRIVDGRGRRLRTLVDGLTLPSGRHQRRWDGRSADGRAASSGVYYLHLRVGDHHDCVPVTLVR